MNFADLKNRHQGETIWIIGTGPGLDRLVSSPADLIGPRIFLNRSAYVAPPSDGETYWLVMDDVFGGHGNGAHWDDHLAKVISGKAETLAVFRDPLLNRDPPTPAPRGENILTWAHNTVRPKSRLLDLSRDEVADIGALYVECGSAAPAAHLAWFMGADMIRFVGLDGGHQRAKCLQQYYDTPSRGGWGYGMMTSSGHHVANELGVKTKGYGGPDENF